MAITSGEWHKAYDDPDSGLSARLRVVQHELREAISRCAPGPVKLVSVCAGQGHDVVAALLGHPRCNDVSATLIELDNENVQAACERVIAAGLTNVHVIEGDAAQTDIYHGLVPADVVLVCGLFGNVSDEDIRRTINHLPMLCANGASVLWTRGGFLPEQIRSWFAEAGFERSLMRSYRRTVLVWPGSSAHQYRSNLGFTSSPSRGPGLSGPPKIRSPSVVFGCTTDRGAIPTTLY